MPTRLTFTGAFMRSVAPALARLVTCLSLAGCALALAGQNADYNPAKPHHRPDGFVNRYAPAPGHGSDSLLKWQWERLRDGLPKPPAAPVTGVAPDLAVIRSPGPAPAATWVGHATVLVQVDGLNLLTDPHWGERASPVPFAGPRRHQPPGVPFDALPPIHAVLISHNHWDHLDEGTVQRLMDRHPGIRFYVPLGVQRWFKLQIRGARTEGPGQNVFALDWDDSATLPGATAPVTLQFLAVQHWSARMPWDRNQTLWGSWAVLHPSWRFWFSGDLGYSPDTQDIGRRLGRVDLAAIAVGAYQPRWFMQASHIDPAEALQVMRDVRARSAFGIHWGTFEGLSDEPLDQPPQDLRRAIEASPDKPEFRVLRHGQTWRME